MGRDGAVLFWFDGDELEDPDTSSLSFCSSGSSEGGLCNESARETTSVLEWCNCGGISTGGQ